MADVRIKGTSHELIHHPADTLLEVKGVLLCPDHCA